MRFYAQLPGRSLALPRGALGGPVAGKSVNLRLNRDTLTAYREATVEWCRLRTLPGRMERLLRPAQIDATVLRAHSGTAPTLWCLRHSIRVRAEPLQHAWARFCAGDGEDAVGLWAALLRTAWQERWKALA